MVQLGDVSFTSFVEAGVNLPKPVELHLLPLLKPNKQVKPPLQRLPSGSLKPARVVFTTSNSSQKTTWTSTNHVFPAAYPRSHFHASHLPGPEQIVPHAEVIQLELEDSKDEKKQKRRKQIEKQFRQKDIDQFVEQLSSFCAPETVYPPHSKEEAERIANTLKDSEQPQFWSCVQRIVPVRDGNGQKGNKDKKAITLFLSHANGFHKEIYEPMLETLLNKVETQDSEIYVEEIWSIDTFNSGDAGILNRGSLSVCNPWWDHARDIQQFLQSYLPPLQRGTNTNLDTQLKEQLSGSGKNGRTIISISHSHSGAASSMLFMTHPNLCDGHISIDPMMFRFEDFEMASLPAEQTLTKGAMIRKDVFKNRKAVAQYMESKPYFAAWDKRVRENHIRFGFYPVPGYEQNGDPPVTLSMSKWSEASNFGHSWTGAWGQMELSRPNPKFKGFCHMIYTEYARTLLPLQNAREQTLEHFKKVGTRFSSSDWDTNHLAVQENPDYSANEIAKVILDHMKHINHSHITSRL